MINYGQQWQKTNAINNQTDTCANTKHANLNVPLLILKDILCRSLDDLAPCTHGTLAQCSCANCLDAFHNTSSNNPAEQTA